MSFRIIGVHPIEAAEPCHLIEVELSDGSAGFDWGEVTQGAPGRDRSNWQVAYDEQELDDNANRWAFFFHYLEFNEPLLTPGGPVALPVETPLPEHLRHVEYDAP
jgi:hypothetical protein